MKMISRFAFVLCAGLLSTAAFADECYDLVAAGKYEQGLKVCTKSAEQGNSWGQYNLALMYDQGQGVTQDYKQAVYWYTKAAEQGDAEAQYNLGLMYVKGEGVPQDYAWFNVAAAQGGNSQPNIL